ncbi:hypothetical protein [Marinomonas gallaica]|uniref:hypothetical protein n=1 Tax=Marinomonas gallaica TaxID=1806667 RepID=UPI00082A0CCF|nr:hypothetical protein [Marinomonas gallaica]
MKIEEEKAPSFTYFLCATIALFAFSIFAIIGFWDFFYHVMDHLINDTPTIIFDRGGTFGLGCFIGLLSLAVGGGIVGVQGKTLTGKIQKVITYGLVIGISIMLLLPIISSIAISVYANNIGYISCEEAEYKPSWPIYRIIYYTQDDATCTELVTELEVERPVL